MSKPSAGMDYAPNLNGKGGSKSGLDKRPPGPTLKLAAHRWAIATICEGDEAVMSRLIGDPRPRFSEGAFRELAPLLLQYFPEECYRYLSETEKHPDRTYKLASLIANRVHKMYYGYNEHHKGRGEASPEHPKYWKASHRALAETRLVEERWPW